MNGYSFASGKWARLYYLRNYAPIPKGASDTE